MRDFSFRIAGADDRDDSSWMVAVAARDRSIEGDKNLSELI
jgi:hypothetical protein